MELFGVRHLRFLSKLSNICLENVILQLIHTSHFNCQKRLESEQKKLYNGSKRACK